MISVDEITRLHAETVALWHQQEIANPYQGFLQLVCQQHAFNYLLWHEEDVARSPDVGDQRIAQVKRAIDKYNQQRNDGIEQLDNHLLQLLAEQKVAPQPGPSLVADTQPTWSSTMWRTMARPRPRPPCCRAIEPSA